MVTPWLRHVHDKAQGSTVSGLHQCLSKQQRQLGGAGQTPWGCKENFNVSSKSDTATLGWEGQNKRALPMLAMNTGFRYISRCEKVSQIKTKSLACTYSTPSRVFISTAIKAFFFNRGAFYTAKMFSKSICQTISWQNHLPSNIVFTVQFLAPHKL